MFAFPFSTCESSGKGLSQPYSAALNALTCSALLGLACVAKTAAVQTTLVAYALFEAWHTYSHARHVVGTTQANVVHVLAYAMAFATLNSILALSGGGLSGTARAAIIAAVVVDLVVWARVGGFWTVLSGLTVFSVVVVSNYDRLPLFFRANVPYLIAGILLLFGLVVNEARNCEAMMRFKALPYHLAVEVVGLALFATIAVLFLRWERRRTPHAGLVFTRIDNRPALLTAF